MAAMGLWFLRFLVDDLAALAVQLVLRRRAGAAPNLQATQQGDHQKLLWGRRQRRPATQLTPKDGHSPLGPKEMSSGKAQSISKS